MMEMGWGFFELQILIKDNNQGGTDHDPGTVLPSTKGKKYA